ncbi:MAG: agmatine deiminase family protein [Planctomycetota bacterium]|nr:agmatine deiminase family protein [Planctomycetota bacterium]MCX8040332.1 agmatine deiminase family protein [Planctomycetota bacterium]MDW8373788.1 agmatine deiminase family protein [Planctomycetota bacterium]
MDGIPERRWPAEWEPVGAVLLAWPHAASDWAPYLDAVRACYRGLAAAVARHAPLLVLADDAAAVRRELLAAGVAARRAVVRDDVPYDDTWIRDYGPLAVWEDGRLRLRDFAFNGWGLKFRAAADNQATRRLHAAGAFGATPLDTVGLVLEGGAVEGDGAGTVLTTAACLLSPNRNPHLTRAEIEGELARWLGARRVLWLTRGRLLGDDTDAHIDTLARFCPDGATILYQRCDDPGDPHFPELAAMEAELAQLSRADGRPYRLAPLPWPAPRYCPRDGHRLPASYANLLFVNGAVLVPSYGDDVRDQAALAAVASACPGWRVEPVDCSALLWQHGALHCATLQLPAGAVP